MGAIPNTIDIAPGTNIGMVIGLACSGRLITPELVVAMQVQPNPTHFSSATICIKNQPVHIAREIIADKAVEVGAKFLWFVDDDTIPPPNTVRRLIYVLENHPTIKVCGGVYVTKSDPPQPVIFRGKGLGSFWKWKVGDVFEVTGMGAGCMMINCEVFKHLPKPWFGWEETNSFTPDVPSTLVSEDISFCDKVRAAGFKVFAHGGVLCDHFDCNTGETFQLPPDSYPYSAETTDLETVPTPELANMLPLEKEKEGN